MWRVFRAGIPRHPIQSLNAHIIDSLLQVDAFFEQAKLISQKYSSNNVLITMGDDFHYQNARMWFENLDKLIL